MPIHLLRITVDRQWLIKNRDNFVVDFINNTCGKIHSLAVWIENQKDITETTLYHHNRHQKLTSTTPFVCACASSMASTMPQPAHALFARMPDTCLLMPCRCRVPSVHTRLPRHYFG